MSNWLHRARIRPRARNNYEFQNQTIIEKEKLFEGNAVARYVAKCIVPCANCGQKFQINKELKTCLEKRNIPKICPLCAGVNKPYLMVSKGAENAIKRLHEAQGCTVQKMTEEEKLKYINN